MLGNASKSSLGSRMSILLAVLPQLEFKLKLFSYTGSLDEAARMTISTCHFQGHTPLNCELIWKNVANPQINVGKWSVEEDRHLGMLAEKHGMRHWVRFV